ncbi:unnamed protein product [Triticum turgidum subsp. durum]|uniref:Chitinase n=1 Tax=Triticum turgidum subsp. durum TaxID=4567 RepID=A0A9R0YU58_TRITD|nr:unnamed protein product [Triticum turgidum subsp. durum]
MAVVCAKAVLLAAVMLASVAQLCMGARRRMELYRPDPADMLSYHNGAVLHGDIAVSVLWYGNFKPAQKAVIVDFLLSLTACPGVFGNGAYPGYAGDLKVDQATGASYNCNGAHGRKYLLPALYDPSKSACGTLV